MIRRAYKIWACIAVLAAIGTIAALLYTLNRTRSTAPEITFTEKTHFDFGVVDEGKTVTRSFKFTNTGKGPLNIKSVKTSCGCTGADVSKNHLHPGESSKILVHYKGRKVRSRETVQVWVTSDDPEKPTSVLTLTVRVRLKVFWYPQSVSFYTNKSGPEECQDVVVLTDYKDGVVNVAKVSSDMISASCFQKDGQSICRIKLSAKREEGNRAEVVHAVATIGQETVRIKIPVYITVAGATADATDG